jgi:hypothetical protein
MKNTKISPHPSLEKRGRFGTYAEENTKIFN